jgi:hypothetical protein
MAVLAVLAVGLLGSGVVAASARGTSSESRTAGTSPVEDRLGAASRASGTLPSDEPADDPTPAADGGSGLPEPYLGNRTPGSVVVPFAAGRSTWEGTSNGTKIRVAIEPARPQAGQKVTFLVEASRPGTKCCMLTIQYGDDAMGYWPAFAPSATEPVLGGPTGCGSRDPSSDSVRAELSHAYNRAGRWTFRVTARSGGECDTGAVHGAIEGTLQVGGNAAPATGQGPSQPRVRPASIYPYEPRVMTLSAEAADDDGHVARLVVDWGDGSPTQSYANPRPCRTTASGWPAGSYTILPHWMGVGPVTHHYADDGRYRVTVTVVSTDCAGGTEQSASGSTWFPGPPPPPIEEVMATAPVPESGPPPLPIEPASAGPPDWTPPPPPFQPTPTTATDTG